MDQNLVRPDLLPLTVPTAALWTMAVVGVALWFLVHRTIVRRHLKPHIRLGILSAVGFAASWSIFQVLGRHFFLAGPWHLIFTAALTAVSIEVVSLLYSRESVLMNGRSGHIVVACRIIAMIIALFMLLQPVLVGEKTRTIRRRIAVFVDDSASMHFRDKHWTLEGRLEVAAALGALKDSGLSLAGLSDELEKLRVKFATYADLADAGAGVLNNADVAADANAAAAALKSRAETMMKIAAKLDALPAGAADEFFDLKDGVGRVARHTSDSVATEFEKLAAAAANENADLRASLAECVQRTAQIAAVASEYELAGYVVAFSALNEAEKQAVLAVSDTTRAAIAARLINEPGNRGSPVIAHLKEVYDVDVYRFASGTEVENLKAGVFAPEYATQAGTTNIAARVEAFRSSTDMTAAMETALREIPFEELAGVLFFTDGGHNGNAGVDAVARRLGAAGIPVSSVVIGGTIKPMDLAFAEARAPDSVFLGDKVRISGTVVATGAQGKEPKLRLILGDKVIEEQRLYITSNDFAQEFRFTDLPEEHGVIRYRLELDILEGEEFTNNNAWELDVSVTDDRTNVLLVDNRPRWEFRYLRNLFYGRDKSVHLQELLLRPDTVAGANSDPLPPASATRKFGDSESGDFPADRDEWRRFDVIIIGDLDETQLNREVINNIQYCVRDRGALLVVIAGPESMPSKIHDRVWREMLPVEYNPDGVSRRIPPEGDRAFNFRLTPAGRGHQAMMLSSSQFENESIWNDFPTFDWRFPVNGVKPGAEVLAYAVPEGDELVSMASLAVRDLANDPEAAVRRIEEMRKKQAVNSLAVAHSYGQGKVLMLNTDRTWRLRYKVGDTYHHQFWGQIIRWGTGEKLRAGNQYVRLGTDRLRYTPTDEIKIYARIVDTEFNVIPNARPRALVSNEDGREIKSVALEFRKDSNGFYEATLDALADPGVYTIRLDSPRAKNELGPDYPKEEELMTRFVVVTAEKPAEFVNVTANRDMPLKLALITKGGVVGPSGIANIWDDFGEGNRILHEPVEKYLWDSWLLFALIIALLTTEWIIRKRNGMP
ncbi:MAG: hypothetical protein FWG05_04195 [Kiritimatiellaeota bacterium]|nr:hypothetical protein [Kiritimatiellota bacterium]